MLRFFLLLVGTLLWLLASCSPSSVKDSSGCKTYPCLIFEDKFDTLNLQTWEHEITGHGGFNGEFQYYHNNRSNSYVKNGLLHIKATPSAERFGEGWLYNGELNLWGHTPADVCTGNQMKSCEKKAPAGGALFPMQSARIRTANSFSFRYGRMEVEAKMPKGDWLWPAIWMLPRFQKYSSWPMSGEVDLVEVRGNAELYEPDGEQIGLKQLITTQHYGPYPGENGFRKARNVWTLANGRDFGDDFHRFRMDWDETGFKYYLDDTLYLNVETGDGYWVRGGWDKRLGNDSNVWGLSSKNKDAPFDQEFYIILNVAVGSTGVFFHDRMRHPSYPKPWVDSYGWESAMRQFWENRNLWLPTWPDNDDRAMQINYIRVSKLKPDCWLTEPPTCHR